jgi:hypothetical protein
MRIFLKNGFFVQALCIGRYEQCQVAHGTERDMEHNYTIRFYA